MSKGLEALSEMVIHLNNKYARTRKALEDFRNIEKELKALEIIKEKKVFVAGLIWHFENDANVNEYNCKCGWAKSDLTQEEYDLLKEVLWEKLK